MSTCEWATRFLKLLYVVREKSTTSFRSYKEAAKAKHELELKWSDKMKEGVDEKQVIAHRKEMERLDHLAELKKSYFFSVLTFDSTPPKYGYMF